MSSADRKELKERRERDAHAARIRSGLAGVWLRHLQIRAEEKQRRKAECVKELG
jgi:hypothetical protein